MTGEDWHKEVNPKTLERLWLIEHFRVLPTDERYLRLSDTQVSLLMANWLESCDELTLKRIHWQSKKKTSAKAALADEDLAALGYSAEEIDAIKAEL